MSPADLEREFRRVHRERMRDLPLANPALQVAAIGFRRWKDYHLGAMLTPWFMSLALLPCAQNRWSGLRIGAVRSVSFPSGTYDFLLSELEGIGRYLACSLYSPVFEFEDQSAAVAAARAVLEALFEERGGAQPSSAMPSGLQPVTAGGVVQTHEPPGPTNLSRRDFLRGKRRDG